MSKYLEKIGLNAKIAFEKKINNKKKNKVLNYYAQLILKNQNKILVENTKDIKIAKSKKLKENLIKRLALNKEKIKSIIKSIKTIASFKTGADVFRFLDMSTKALEIESGVASNEPVNYAVRSAIEYCVYLILAQGDAKGYWTIQ